MPPSDQELLFVGSTCHLESCRLNDFLPLNCSHCSYTFCSSHFLPEAHHCDKWDPSAHNRVAPNCPFCKIPVAYPSDSDPNEALEKHFETNCEALGKAGSSKRSSQVCAQARCPKVLISPIRCQQCSKQFCPEHRFPATHACATVSASARASPLPETKASATKAALTKGRGTTADSGALRTPIMSKFQGHPSGSKHETTKIAISQNARLQTASLLPAKVAVDVPSKAKLPFSKTDRCDPSPPSSPSLKPISPPVSTRSLLFPLSFAPPPLFSDLRSPTVSVRA